MRTTRQHKWHFFMSRLTWQHHSNQTRVGLRCENISKRNKSGDAKLMNSFFSAKLKKKKKLSSVWLPIIDLHHLSSMYPSTHILISVCLSICMSVYLSISHLPIKSIYYLWQVGELDSFYNGGVSRLSSQDGMRVLMEIAFLEATITQNQTK